MLYPNLARLCADAANASFLSTCKGYTDETAETIGSEVERVAQLQGIDAVYIDEGMAVPIGADALDIAERIAAGVTDADMADCDYVCPDEVNEVVTNFLCARGVL